MWDVAPGGIVPGHKTHPVSQVLLTALPSAREGFSSQLTMWQWEQSESIRRRDLKEEGDSGTRRGKAWGRATAQHAIASVLF